MIFMNKRFSNVIDFVTRYKFLFLLGFPLVLTLVLIIAAPTPPTPARVTNESQTIPTSSSTNSNTNPRQTSGGNIAQTTSEEILEEEDLDARPGLINKKTLSNNINEYTFTSENATRPDLVIAQGKSVILFERDVAMQQYPTRITDYTQPYGQPERIITGSSFYGANAQTYIYAEDGIAFVANPQSQIVYEQHLFPPMTVDEYIQSYFSR